MGTIVKISGQSFADKFKEVIRVGLNWDRLYEERWPIVTVTLKTPEDLHRCFMPWYIGPDGNEVGYDDEHAVPMRLTDVPKSFHLLNKERKGDIQAYVDEFRRNKGIVRFMAPTYALPDNQYFILDRNHRLSALTLNEVPFEVTLWNVCGPLEQDGLLDVLYWLPPQSRPLKATLLQETKSHG